MKDFNKSYGKALGILETGSRQALDLHLDMLPLVQDMIGDSV